MEVLEDHPCWLQTTKLCREHMAARAATDQDRREHKHEYRCDFPCCS